MPTTQVQDKTLLVNVNDNVIALPVNIDCHCLEPSMKLTKAIKAVVAMMVLVMLKDDLTLKRRES